MLYINICNQLGNCYLKKNNLKKSLENFEMSLVMIQKMESEKDVLRDQSEQEENHKINPLIVAKICLNVGLIRA